MSMLDTLLMPKQRLILDFYQALLQMPPDTDRRRAAKRLHLRQAQLRRRLDQLLPYLPIREKARLQIGALSQSGLQVYPRTSLIEDLLTQSPKVQHLLHLGLGLMPAPSGVNTTIHRRLLAFESLMGEDQLAVYEGHLGGSLSAWGCVFVTLMQAMPQTAVKLLALMHPQLAALADSWPPAKAAELQVPLAVGLKLSFYMRRRFEHLAPLPGSYPQDVPAALLPLTLPQLQQVLTWSLLQVYAAAGFQEDQEALMMPLVTSSARAYSSFWQEAEAIEQALLPLTGPQPLAFKGNVLALLLASQRLGHLPLALEPAPPHFQPRVLSALLAFDLTAPLRQKIAGLLPVAVHRRPMLALDPRLSFADHQLLKQALSLQVEKLAALNSADLVVTTLPTNLPRYYVLDLQNPESWQKLLRLVQSL